MLRDQDGAQHLARTRGDNVGVRAANNLSRNGGALQNRQAHAVHEAVLARQRVGATRETAQIIKRGRVEQLRVGVLVGVCVVDAIDVRAEDDALGLAVLGAQSGLASVALAVTTIQTMW